jgi:endoglucanase
MTRGFSASSRSGGFDERTLIAQRVLVHGFDGGVYRGVVQPGAKPIHLLDKSEIKPPKLDDLFVDIGLPADRVTAAVEVGDMVTLDRTLEEVGGNVVSKALEDRVSVYAMIESLRAVQNSNAEVVAVATVQEEVGLRGAQTAAFDLRPQIAVALDITLAVDIPGAPPESAVTKLGQGVAIKVMDGSSISHPKLLRHLRDLAEANGIPYQLEILPRGGTDAGAMQLAAAGCPAITLSIPTRYVHTVNEMASRADIGATVALLARSSRTPVRGTTPTRSREAPRRVRFHPDEQPAVPEAIGQIRHVEAGGDERRQVLLVAEEPEFVPLDKGLDGAALGDQVVGIERRDAASATEDSDEGDLDLGEVDELGVDGPIDPLLPKDPWGDDRHATRVQVARQVHQDPPERLDGRRVPDRTAEAEHRVEAATEVEARHVGMVEPHMWHLRPGHDQHRRVEVQALDREAGP